MEAARALDVLTVATRAPSMPLALARAAASVQSHRRIRLENGDHHDVLATDLMPFANSRASTSQAGPAGASPDRSPGFRPGDPAPRQRDR